MNGIYAITTEGQKVAKDEVVFRYYKESEKETTENIKKIDYEIQEELEKDKIISIISRYKSYRKPN